MDLSNKIRPSNMSLSNRQYHSGCKDWLSVLMLKRVIIFLDMYPVLSRQIKSNHEMRFESSLQDAEDADSSQKRNIPSNCAPNNESEYQQVPLIKELATTKKWMLTHFVVCMVIYVFEILRYTLIHLISLDSLFDFHYLDCYLVGRFRFIGRTNKISSRMMLTFLSAFIAYRYIIFVLRPKFNFQALEFMLHKYEYVRENENKFKSNLTARLLCGRQPNCLPPLEFNITSSGIQPNGIFYLRNQFYGDSIECEWILRPNRTSKSWTILSTYARIAFYLTAMTTLLFILLISYTIGGSILTNLGFEMSYPTCVAWLQDKQRGGATNNDTASGGHNELPYSYIYLTPEKLAHQIRIENIPAIIPVSLIDLHSTTNYNLVRIFADLGENLFWYIEFLSMVTCVYFMTILCAIDIMINANEVERRLKRLIASLRELNSKNSTLNADLNAHETNKVDIISGSSSLKLTNNCPGSDHYLIHQALRKTSRHQRGSIFMHHSVMAKDRAEVDTSNGNDTKADKLARETTILQAILVDHFLLVRDYNQIVTFYVKFVIFIFSLYTLVISYWTSTIKSRTVEFEFLVGEATATFFAILFFLGAALARSLNYHIYTLITQAMALDSNSNARRRWTIILNYYKPRPLYCFILFGSTEISWLFCLKFASWIVSAFVVLANFFYMNRH